MSRAFGAAAGAVLALGVGGVVTGPGALTAQAPGDLLRGLAREWVVVSEARLGPDVEPVRSERREEGRMIGRWLVLEGTATTPTGEPVASIFTLGPGGSPADGPLPRGP
jgi:hypothetical protein